MYLHVPNAGFLLQQHVSGFEAGVGSELRPEAIPVLPFLHYTEWRGRRDTTLGHARNSGNLVHLEGVPGKENQFPVSIDVLSENERPRTSQQLPAWVEPCLWGVPGFFSLTLRAYIHFTKKGVPDDFRASTGFSPEALPDR